VWSGLSLKTETYGELLSALRASRCEILDKLNNICFLKIILLYAVYRSQQNALLSISSQTFRSIRTILFSNSDPYSLREGVYLIFPLTNNL